MKTRQISSQRDPNKNIYILNFEYLLGYLVKTNENENDQNTVLE